MSDIETELARLKASNARIKKNIANAYSSIEEKGGEVPTEQNSANLTATIAAVPGANAYAGSFDKEGLEYLGYDDETIEWYNAFCSWSKEFDEDMKLTDQDKSIKELCTKWDDFSSYFTYSGQGYAYVPFVDTSSKTSFDSSAFKSASFSFIVPKFDTSNATGMDSMFSSCIGLKTIPKFDTSKVTSMSGMFYGCTSLITIPQLDTSNVTNFSYLFYNCASLKCVPELDFSSATKVGLNVFYPCYSLTYFGGAKDLGKSFDTSKEANYSDYILRLMDTKLITHDSLMNVINDLYDIAAKGCNTQKLILGSTNLAKLTADEIAIATNKGFSVS